jgi:hypothetical protein
MNTRRFSSFGTILAILGFTFMISTDTFAGGRRRVVAVSPTSSSALSIAFVDAPAGLLDTGVVVWRGGAKRSTVTTRTVRMRIGEAASEPRGNVTVRAFLETPDPRCTIRIDGVTLTAAPRAIRRNAPVGIVFTHRIEIEVPVTAADGPLLASIGWEITPE